jgi:hypothetical protein
MTVVAITPDTVLYRRLAASHVYPDDHRKVEKRGKVNSTAFKYDREPQQEISVEIAAMTTIEECANRGKYAGRGHGVGALTVRDVERLGLRVRHDPVRGDPDRMDTEAHAVIVREGGPITMDDCDRLASITTVVLKPRR